VEPVEIITPGPVEVDILMRQITAGRYARAWAADELFVTLNEYERSFRT
jgi:hypothetical protein